NGCDSPGGITFFGVFLQWCNPKYGTIRKDFNSQAFRFLKKPIYNGLGRIGSGKHSAIRFNIQLYAPFLKEGHGISTTIGVKWANKFPFPPGIIFGNFPRIKFGMGNVAAPPTGYLYLGKHLLATFHDGYF